MRKRNKLLILLGLPLCALLLSPLSYVHADMAAPYSFESDPNFSEEDYSNPDKVKKAPLSQYIINEESYLYKGPNEKYGKVDDEYHLPAGIIITSTYYDDLWMYVEHEGHTGWIYHYNTFVEKNPKTANLATEWNKSIITTRSQIELKSSPFEDGEVVATFNVTPLTEIPVLYYFGTNKTASWVFLTYGEYSGWYLKDAANYGTAIRREGNQLCITIRETSAADTVDSEATSFTIPANTKLTIQYYSIGTLYGTDRKEYVSYVMDGGTTLSGWVKNDDVAFSASSSGVYTEKTLNQAQPIFNTVDGVETGEFVSAGTYKILYYYTVRADNADDDETWYYLGKYTSSPKLEEIGWIKASTTSEIKTLEEQKQTEIKEIINEEPEETQSFVEEKTNNTKSNKQDQITSTLTWLLVGFGLLSITIIVVLIIQKKHGAIGTPEEPSSETDGSDKPKTKDSPSKTHKADKSKTEKFSSEANKSDESDTEYPSSEADESDEPDAEDSPSETDESDESEVKESSSGTPESEQGTDESTDKTESREVNND